MLGFVTKKIKNKMWLTICLVIGLAFLVATLSCQPMFKAGSLDKLLDNIFQDYIKDVNEYPTVLGRSGGYTLKEGVTSDNVMADLDNLQAGWLDGMDIEVATTQTNLFFDVEVSETSFGSTSKYLSVSYMPEMENHIEMLCGSDYISYETVDEMYPCIISQRIMEELGLVEGEIIEFVNWSDSSGNTLKLIVSGVYKEKERVDDYWRVEPAEYENNLFVSKETFDYVMNNFESKYVYFNHNVMLDYTQINYDNVQNVLDRTTFILSKDEKLVESYSGLLEEFKANEKTVNVILWVLEFPILGMILAFIYMVSKQIIQGEKNEIAMLKSRGISKVQVIFIYLLQFALLSVVGYVTGIPLGCGLCIMAGNTTDFLTFGGNNIGAYSFNADMLLYGVLGILIGIVFILIPVVKYSKVSIVEVKSDYNNKKPFWEKYFLDIALLGVSIYLVYSEKKSIEQIRLEAISGNKMDPVIFINSILFIIAFGLVTLRLTHLLVKLVYHIGRKKWKPAMYASFLQITRSFGKQGFISVFLILTVSMGIFNANVARTINHNNVDRIEYENGCDVTVQEKWAIKKYYYDMYKTTYDFIEPDYLKYTKLVDEGLCENVTRVIKDDKTIASKNGLKIKDCMLQGIYTDEFGRTAMLKEELNENTHWYTYLNELAVNPNGVIISKSLSETLSVEVGDVIVLTRNGAIPQLADEERGTLRAKVVAIVEAWPGYEPYYYEDGEEKQRHLVVGNYATIVKAYKISPYEIWMKTSEGVTAVDIYNSLLDKGVELEYISSIQTDVERMKDTPLIQITNGMFTLCFIIALILCAVGFMIYWITSIRQRELLFGIYRAMGMSVKDVNKMLINEHVFSTFLSVITGGLVGMVATLVFVGLYGVVYLPKKHVMDIYIYYEAADIIKLALVIVIMIFVCFIVIRRIIKAMNITQALKLGEE